VRQQFGKTTWITPDCNSPRPAGGRVNLVFRPIHTLRWSPVDQCCHPIILTPAKAGAHGRNGSRPPPGKRRRRRDVESFECV
jgi:hypothetical protein